ncbi:hypothetical protein WJX84_010063 [Apatococcus fuscideae]|uniref:Uncharacterized protein n=1 Tax=Apatococcus fuscideae TaxID=2026836 RepID=A0AAW1T0V5_9CHLO
MAGVQQRSRVRAKRKAAAESLWATVIGEELRSLKTHHGRRAYWPASKGSLLRATDIAFRSTTAATGPRYCVLPKQSRSMSTLCICFSTSRSPPERIATKSQRQQHCLDAAAPP